MNTIKPTIIVTRHEHLVTVLRERGIVDVDTPVLTHVDTPEQVSGKHVIGVLPHHLSARAASVTEIPMRWSQADREAMARGDVGLDGTRRAAGDPISYVVQPINGGGIDRSRPRWLAVARAYEHVERCGQHFGSGPGSLRYLRRMYRGLDVTAVGDGAETASAEVIESRGVWRPECRGPWLDGYGCEVDQDTIAPAGGWMLGNDLVEADQDTVDQALRDLGLDPDEVAAHGRETLQRMKSPSTCPACGQLADLNGMETCGCTAITREQLTHASGTLLSAVGRALRMKRVRHDIGAQESDDQYRSRLLAELDRRGHTGVQL